jgi:hypothetical protein
VPQPASPGNIVAIQAPSLLPAEELRANKRARQRNWRCNRLRFCWEKARAAIFECCLIKRGVMGSLSIRLLEAYDKKMFQLRRIFSALLAAVILVGAPVANSTAGENRVSAAPTDAQIAAVRAAAARIPADLRKQFEDRFAAWKKTWSEPPLVFSSSPRDLTHSIEFRGLVALGKDIIPAVVEKLIDPDNFFALQLYYALQSESRLIPSAPEDAFESEQARARETIQLYASNL